MDIETRQSAVAASLAAKMRDMEANASRTVSQLEDERRQVWRGLETAAREFVSKETSIGDRLHTLESQMTELRRSSTGVDNLETQLESMRRELDDEKNASIALRRELQEAAGKEVAFRETLAKADAIVASLEKGILNTDFN